MVDYIFHKYVTVALFVNLCKNVFCNNVVVKDRLFVICIFNLIHARIQYRIITGLSDWKDVGIV